MRTRETHLEPKAAQLLTQIIESIATQKEHTSDQVLSSIEAARYLNVSRPYVVKLFKEGKIPHHMVESHHRVYFRDLEAYKKHFPLAALEPHEITCIDPDDFVIRLIDESPSKVVLGLHTQRTRFINPHLTVDESLAKLYRQRLPLTIQRLQMFKSDL